MKLVLITEIIAPYRIPVFNALARHKDIDLHVVFLAETDATQRAWLVYKNEIKFSYQVLSSRRRRFGARHALLNWGVSAALRRSRPDAILCGGYNYLASWIALRWARRRKIPFLLWAESTARDQRRGRSVVESLKKKFMRGCAAFVVPGKSSFEYLRNYDVPEEAIFTAPNAVDNDLFSTNADAARRESKTRRAALKVPQRYFLFVGRFVPQKGIFDLLDAYNTLPEHVRSSCGLVYVGDGTSEAELQEKARSQNGVQVAGFAQRDQLASYYGLADILVFPTHSDPWGLVVNEAMACGLPVIASDAAGCTADLVQDNWNGRVIAPGNIEELAASMQQLAQSEELRFHMGRHSRECIMNYSPEACARGIAQAVLNQGSQNE